MIKKIFDSAKELTVVRSLTLAGMLLALIVIIGYFANFTLAILPVIKLSFSFVPQSVAAMMLGPIPSAIIGGLGDFLSFLLNPQGGAYFFGWTLNSILTGFVYGLFLYKCEKLLVNLIAARLIIFIFIEVVLGSLWLNVQFGWPYVETLVSRTITNAITIPVEIAIIFVISGALKRILRHKRE